MLSCSDFKWPTRLCLLCVVLVLMTTPLVSSFCPSMCQCDDGLLETSCQSSRLDSVPILLNPALRTLRLGHNRIASLRQSVSFYTELRWLDLSHNSLHSLGVMHFQSLQALEWLNISSNLISTLETQSFSGLYNVAVLDLSGNRLTRLTSGLFSEMGSLTTLVLSGNKIQSIDADAFDLLRHLHTLRLDDNNIQHVPVASMTAISNLYNLHLGKNLIETIDDLALESLSKLRVLRINDNAISRIESLAFTNLANLELLDLSFNRLDSGPIKALHALSALRHLDLSGNIWRQLPAAFLRGLHQLETLNISYMEYLRWVHPDALRMANGTGEAALTHLIMTNNALWSRLPVRLLDDLPRLQRIDLSGNAFETLAKPQRFDQWSLKYLNVAYNPLECNCSLVWLWKLYHNESSDLVVVNVTCSAPQQSNGRQLSHLKEHELLCTLAMSTGALVALLVTLWLVFTAAAVALVLYYRKNKKLVVSSYGTSPILTKHGSPNSGGVHYYPPARDEYTYHCAGSIKRIPVTVV